MKKTFILLGAFLLSVLLPGVIHAQSAVSCAETLNEFFGGGYQTTNPTVLNRLGTSPQFGEIKKHTADGAYTHLSAVYKRNRGNSAFEIDRYLKALGYTGFKDPAFTKDKITPEILPAGTVGWMGTYAKAHKYKWSRLGKDFETFKIQAKDSPCYAYIMKKCGNAFYTPVECKGVNPCPECNVAGFTYNPFCPCTPCPTCAESVSQTLSLTGDGDIKSGACITGEKEINLVAEYEGSKLCLGSMSVPLNVSYEYAASGSTSASQVVQVDNTDGDALSSLALKIPVILGFDVVGNELAFGDNGTIKMMVTKKRFKALKKIYSACPTDMPSATVTGLSAPEIDVVSAVTPSSVSDGKTGLKKQTLYFSGSKAISEVVSKEHNPTMTVIAHAKKTGKLVKGESADKYLCMGQYSVPASSALAYKLTGGSKLTKSLEICDDKGSEPAEKYIDLPIDLNASFTKQEMKAGHDGKVYVEITESQYKKLAKRFSRCCSNGDESCF